MTPLFSLEKQSKKRSFCQPKVFVHFNTMWSSIQKTLEEMKRNDRKISLKYIVSLIKVSSKNNNYSVNKTAGHTVVLCREFFSEGFISSSFNYTKISFYSSQLGFFDDLMIFCISWIGKISCRECHKHLKPDYGASCI